METGENTLEGMAYIMNEKAVYRLPSRQYCQIVLEGGIIILDWMGLYYKKPFIKQTTWECWKIICCGFTAICMD